jgi:hypothetical protein
MNQQGRSCGLGLGRWGSGISHWALGIYHSALGGAGDGSGEFGCRIAFAVEMDLPGILIIIARCRSRAATHRLSGHMTTQPRVRQDGFSDPGGKKHSTTSPTTLPVSWMRSPQCK